MTTDTTMTEEHERASPLQDLADAWEVTRSTAIEELEQAQAYLTLMLAQLRTRTGDEQDRAYSFSRFHKHASNGIATLAQYGGKVKLEGMQPKGSA